MRARTTSHALTALAVAVLLLGACGAAAARRSAQPPAQQAIRLPHGVYPEQLALGDDGSLWLTDLYGGVGRLDAHGGFREFAIGEDSQPSDLVRGPDGAIWFASYDGIGRVDASGAVSRFSPSASALTAAGGEIWFADDDRPARVGHLAPGGVARSFAVPGTTQTYYAIQGIAAGPDGALWFTQSGYDRKRHDRIGRMTPDGHYTAWLLPHPRAAPARIAAGPDGALWFTQPDAHAIGRISTSGAIAELPLVTGLSPYEIAAGADGALWFTADACIGRVTTAGGVTAWRVRGAKRLRGIAAAPDGSLWVADDESHTIFHVAPGLDPAPPQTPCSPPSITKRHGATRATLVYHRATEFADGPGDDARVRIARGGRQLFAETVPPSPVGLDTYVVFADPPSFALRDLDGDGEPEVLLELYWDGAHCCTWSRVYRYVAARRTYVPSTHFWGDDSSRPRIADLNGDGVPELTSDDDRFAYDFDGYAGSVRPIRIWSYRRGAFRDVTRRFPNQIRHDATAVWKLYAQYRGKSSVRGILPAWAADEELLGRDATVWRVLERARRLGVFDTRPCDRYDPCGEAYVKAVRALLGKLGYLRG